MCVLGKHVEVRENLQENQFSPSITWVLRINLRMPGLQPQDARLGSVKYLYSLNHLTNPNLMDSWHVIIACFMGYTVTC